jgi:hypothetical protein
MKTKTVRAAVAVTLLAAAGVTNAGTVISTLGDKDGFGIGVSHGAGFDYSTIGAGDGDGTDVWHDGSLTFVLDYSLPGQITAASVELFSGGFGFEAPAQLYLNGTLVGTLTVGDDIGPLHNSAFKDTFDLTSFSALLTGHDAFEIRLAAGDDDSGALDYAQLTVTGDVVTTVPEPGTNALLAIGLAALVATRRRAKSSGARARRSS